MTRREAADILSAASGAGRGSILTCPEAAERAKTWARSNPRADQDQITEAIARLAIWSMDRRR